MARHFLVVAVSTITLVAALSAQQPPTSQPDHMQHRFDDPARFAKSFDDPARDGWQLPARVIQALELKPGMKVADIGAGTGYFTFRIAPKVPEGKVLGVDIQPQMLAMLRRTAERRGVKNVEPVRGREDDPNLPEAGVDVALMVDAYHEFDHPREMMQGIVRGLKPGGRVVLVEYRAEDPDVPIKPLHKMSEAQAVKEMAAVGLKHLKTHADLPRQHVMVFQKPAE